MRSSIRRQRHHEAVTFSSNLDHEFGRHDFKFIAKHKIPAMREFLKWAAVNPRPTPESVRARLAAEADRRDVDSELHPFCKFLGCPDVECKGVR